MYHGIATCHSVSIPYTNPLESVVGTAASTVHTTLCRHRDPPRATTPFVTPQESVDESVVNRAQANARIGDRISRDSRVSLTLRIVPKTKEQICTEEAMREAERNERLWYQSISEPSRAM